MQYPRKLVANFSTNYRTILSVYCRFHVTVIEGRWRRPDRAEEL